MLLLQNSLLRVQLIF